MKKKLLAVAVMIAMVLAMTACGGSTDQEESTDNAE